MKLIIYSDGGSRGNPGPAAYAFVIYDENKTEILKQGSGYLGENTNNFAEYEGILHGLKAAIEMGATEIKCYLDSELIVMQANGAYQVKHPVLKEKYKELKELKQKIASVKFIHVPRAENKLADKLVNECLDAA